MRSIQIRYFVYFWGILIIVAAGAGAAPAPYTFQRYLEELSEAFFNGLYRCNMAALPNAQKNLVELLSKYRSHGIRLPSTITAQSKFDTLEEAYEMAEGVYRENRDNPKTHSRETYRFEFFEALVGPPTAQTNERPGKGEQAKQENPAWNECVRYVQEHNVLTLLSKYEEDGVIKDGSVLKTLKDSASALSSFADVRNIARTAFSGSVETIKHSTILENEFHHDYKYALGWGIFIWDCYRRAHPGSDVPTGLERQEWESEMDVCNQNTHASNPKKGVKVETECSKCLEQFKTFPVSKMRYLNQNRLMMSYLASKIVPKEFVVEQFHIFRSLDDVNQITKDTFKAHVAQMFGMFRTGIIGALNLGKHYPECYTTVCLPSPDLPKSPSFAIWKDEIEKCESGQKSANQLQEEFTRCVGDKIKNLRTFSYETQVRRRINIFREKGLIGQYFGFDLHKTTLDSYKNIADLAWKLTENPFSFRRINITSLRKDFVK